MTTKSTNYFLPEKPHFISKPSSSVVTVREKQDVILPCKAAGFPQPVITWYKNGHLIEERQQVKAGRGLEFREIQFEDRGMYTCTAENLFGRDQLSVNVTVQGMESNRYLHCSSLLLEISATNKTLARNLPPVTPLGHLPIFSNPSAQE